MPDIEQLFRRYVSFDTQSSDNSISVPSTKGQQTFIEYLARQMHNMGLENICIDNHSYLMATIPSNLPEEIDCKVPVVGFLAHADTATELSGRDVVVCGFDYSGGDIVINQDRGVILEASRLENYIGHRLLTSDGTTLLGADDKAGIAEIIFAANYLLTHPEIPHGKIRIAITHDEEIGRGMDNFDVEAFGADYAYTVDGGVLGSLEYETFNAARAKVMFEGRAVHPGYAKGQMINAARQAAMFNMALPEQECPECTEGREGFFHLCSMSGDCSSAELNYIIRDHDAQRFESRKQLLRELAERFGARLEMEDQYRNMGEVIGKNMEVVDIACEAMRECGITPIVEPVRGGTDGSRLSFMGVPCPNIFAGGENIHSCYEFVSVDVMMLAAKVIVKICEKYYKNFHQIACRNK